jgi:thiamine transport system substrate-binding protein
MLDIPFQEDIPLTMFVFPVNTQAVLPDVFVEHAEMPETVTSFGLLTDTQRDVFLAEWSAIMLG